MKTDEPCVLSEEQQAAVTELAKAVTALLGKHYPPRPLGWVISMLFSDLSRLQGQIDALLVALARADPRLGEEPAIDELHELQTERMIVQLRHSSAIIQRMADRQVEDDLAQLPLEFFIKAD